MNKKIETVHLKMT